MPPTIEQLSPLEEKFEKYRKKIGLFLGPLLALAIYLIPFTTLSNEAHILASVLCWVVVWWITEPVPIPITALLGAVLCVVLGVADIKKVFYSFGDPIIFLFMGSFIMAQAMAIHQLDKRFSYKIMSLKWVGLSSTRLLFIFGLITAFLSMWISNTATAAIMFPIGLGIINTLSDINKQNNNKNISSFGTGLMLMTAYAASIGGIGTPIGTPPNLIGIAMIENYIGIKISFFQWMLIAVPLLILMFILLFFLIRILHPTKNLQIANSIDFIREELKKLSRWTAGQVNTLIAFAIVVALWILPGISTLMLGNTDPITLTLNKVLPEAVVALIGVLILFLLPTNWKEREFTITWRQAIRIDWGTLILFGGGLALGNLMYETKLAEAIGKGLVDISGLNSLAGITFIAVFLAIFVSEMSSNTASANMVVPVVIALAIAAHINPLIPAIGATLGASWGFMLPISTPPNAIVYGSGYVPITKMIRAGLIFDIIGGLLIWVWVTWFLPFLI